MKVSVFLLVISVVLEVEAVYKNGTHQEFFDFPGRVMRLFEPKKMMRWDPQMAGGQLNRIKPYDVEWPVMGPADGAVPLDDAVADVKEDNVKGDEEMTSTSISSSLSSINGTVSSKNMTASGMLVPNNSTTSKKISTSTPTLPLPKDPSYELFCQAADAYSECSVGGHPRVPSRRAYTTYMDTVARTLSMEEQAMFLANVCWETGGMQYMEEIACRHGGCVYGRYYGRGYIQLTWDYNYRDASTAIFGDDRLVRRPELVATEEIAWKTAFYFWMKHVHPLLERNDAVQKYMIGYSVLAINGGIECHSGARYPNRMQIYNAILRRWGITDKRPASMRGCWADQWVEPPRRIVTTTSSIRATSSVRGGSTSSSATGSVTVTSTSSSSVQAVSTASLKEPLKATRTESMVIRTLRQIN